MVRQRIGRSSSRNHPSKEKSSRLAPNPTANQAQKDSGAPPAHKGIENESFKQNKLEAFGLQLKEERGSTTPPEQARLGVLQAKMEDFWTQRLERASRLGPRMRNLSPSQGMSAEAVQRREHSLRPKATSRALIQRSLKDDLQAIETDKNNTKDPLLKKILEEALATAQKKGVTVRYGESKQKSHAQPVGQHGAGRGFDVVIDETQYTDDRERQSIIVHELLHASSDSKYRFNEKFSESALTTPLRGKTDRESFQFAGEQFRFAGKLATELGQEAEKERGQLGDRMANHVIERAKRITGANTQEFDTVASELLYFMRQRNVDEKTKTFRKVRNMAEAAYNARNEDVPITEGYLEPDSFKELAIKSACFLTTACAYVNGLSDDCEELTVLRSLRDGHMRRREEDEDLVELYDKVAPVILDGIMKEVGRVQILRGLHGAIRRCVSEVKDGRPERAVQIYRGMVVRLQRRFAPDFVDEGACPGPCKAP